MRIGQHGEFAIPAMKSFVKFVRIAQLVVVNSQYLPWRRWNHFQVVGEIYKIILIGCNVK